MGPSCVLVSFKLATLTYDLYIARYGESKFAEKRIWDWGRIVDVPRGEPLLLKRRLGYFMYNCATGWKRHSRVLLPAR